MGRERELDALRAAFERSLRDGCTAVTVAGPAGIGKSRLARELALRLSERATVVVGRCPSYGDSVAYRPLAEIVDQLGAPLEPAVLAAVGRSEGTSQPGEISWAFRRLFEHAAGERPLAVVVEDIHWAESTLLDLLDYLVAFSNGPPILLVCLTRPELLETRPPYGTLLAAGPARRRGGAAADRAARPSARPSGSWRRRRATRCSSSSSRRSPPRESRSRPRSRRSSPPASTACPARARRARARLRPGPDVLRGRAGGAGPGAARKPRAARADPRRALHRPGRGRLPLRPPADPRGRLPGPAAPPLRGAARAPRAAAGRGRDGRPSPRRGLSPPRRARRGRPGAGRRGRRTAVRRRRRAR